MKLAVDYGACKGDIEARIAYFKSLGLARVMLGCWSVPGYGEIEYLSPDALKEIKEPLDKAGIGVEMFWHGESNVGLMMDPEKGEGVLDRFYKTLGTLGESGVPFASVMNTVSVPEESARESLWGKMTGVYKRITGKAGENGVAIVSHTGWKPSTLVWNTETLLKLFEEVPSPGNKALFCAGSIWSAGDEMKRSVKALGDRIGVVHFRDSRERLGGCEEMPLGAGGVEFRDVVAALAETGYRGVIIPEHLGSVAGEKDRTATTAMAVGFIRGIMHALSVKEG